MAFVEATQESPPGTPLKKLFGFDRLRGMTPGASRSVTFSSTADNLAVAAVNGTEYLVPGTYKITIGDVVAPTERLLQLVGDDLIVRSNSWLSILPRSVRE
jgi:hypothetical protein